MFLAIAIAVALLLVMDNIVAKSMAHVAQLTSLGSSSSILVFVQQLFGIYDPGSCHLLLFYFQCWNECMQLYLRRGAVRNRIGIANTIAITITAALSSAIRIASK